MTPQNSSLDFERPFLQSGNPHVLMLTVHGIHEWEVPAGLPDTGRQDAFANQLSAAFAKSGFRVTLANRGGYPHPVSGEMRSGLSYRNEYERILYLQDSRHEFVRKEDLDEYLPELADALHSFVKEEKTPVTIIVSLYWDGGKLGVLLNKRFKKRVKHVWTPLSLGALKKESISPDKWEALRVDERIELEKAIIPEVDEIVATSSQIRESLRNEYAFATSRFLPQCIDGDRFRPREIGPGDELWTMLSGKCGRSVDEVRNATIITGLSRTDTAKRKNILIEAFARVHSTHPDTVLVLNIDERERKLASELMDLIRNSGIEADTVVLNNVEEILPKLYAVTYVFCCPAIRPGHSKAVQEAAATRVPVITTQETLFASENLMGEDTREIPRDGDSEAAVRTGDAAILVPPDDVEGLALALETILSNPEARAKMAKRAYELMVPDFTWQNAVRQISGESGAG